MAPNSLGAAAALAAGLLVLSAGASSGTVVSGPVPSTGPTVIGTAAAGKRLTGLSGSWAGFGVIVYHFQWYRCNAAGAACLSIHGATAPSYAVNGRDIGKTLGLKVFGTDSTGTSSAYSSLIGPIAPPRPLLVATAQATISGSPVVGKTLQVSTGAWSPVPAKLTYRWERCNANGRVCAAIPNTSNTSYTLGSADLGHMLVVLLQGTNGTTIQNAFSTATPAIVGPSVHGPTLTIGPSVSGIAAQRQQLVASTGIWQGVGPIVFGFHWYRCDPSGVHCQTIRGATSAAYTPVLKDVGDTIALTLQATDSVGPTAAYASLVGPVAGEDSPLTPTSLPTITGAATVGGTLDIARGLWSTRPTGFTYAWLRCNANGRLCVAIPGATALSYRLTAEDAGHALAADIVASGDGTTQAALTAATAPVTS